MKPVLVLLAAGESARLGTPKALVDLGGATPLERLLRAGAVLDAHPPVVVTGAAHREILGALPGGVAVVHNPRWAEGRTGGVRLAAEHVAASHGPELALCLAPVDVPLVPATVFEILALSWESAGAPGRGWLAPRFEGRHGHPVVVGGIWRPISRPGAPSRPLRELRERAVPLLAEEVPAREILDDLDTPGDLARLRRRFEGG